MYIAPDEGSAFLVYSAERAVAARPDVVVDAAVVDVDTPLPANADDAPLIQAADFDMVVERPVFSPPIEAPIPDEKALSREDTGQYLGPLCAGGTQVPARTKGKDGARKSEGPGTLRLRALLIGEEYGT
ncbi:hypothetical protein [Myxococcus sp. Y35]|uniref:hypothetical protein n=1 Tax=Pseudomyxococcus flavus TaxID=3115648 RepID=UPI003CEF3FCC